MRTILVALFMLMTIQVYAQTPEDLQFNMEIPPAPQPSIVRVISINVNVLNSIVEVNYQLGKTDENGKFVVISQQVIDFVNVLDADGNKISNDYDTIIRDMAVNMPVLMSDIATRIR